MYRLFTCNAMVWKRGKWAWQNGRRSASSVGSTSDWVRPLRPVKKNDGQFGRTWSDREKERPDRVRPWKRKNPILSYLLIDDWLVSDRLGKAVYCPPLVCTIKGLPSRSQYKRHLCRSTVTCKPNAFFVISICSLHEIKDNKKLSYLGDCHAGLIHSLCQKARCIDLSSAIRSLAESSFVLSQKDGQTDGFAIARPLMHTAPR